MSDDKSKKVQDRKRINRLGLTKTISFLLLSSLLVSIGGLADSGPGDGPPIVWKGPLPDPSTGGCPAEYIPVVDVHGNVYLSPCDAALEGVRVVWLL